jgi:hypothetical protein
MDWQTKVMEGGKIKLEGSSYDGAGAAIYTKADKTCDLFEIPQYGGEEIFQGNYQCLVEAVQVAESWT